MGARHEALQVADQCRTLVKKVLTAAPIRQPCFHFSQAERNPLVVLGAGERARLGNQIRIGDTIGDVGTNGRGFEQIPTVDDRHRHLGQGVKLPQLFPAGQVIAIDEGVFNAGFVQCPLVGLMPANR